MTCPNGNHQGPPIRRYRNPFHFIVLAAGAAFVMVACSYSVLYIKQGSARAEGALDAIEQHPWLAFMDQHGELMLVATLVVLTIAVAADCWWENGLSTSGRKKNANTKMGTETEQMQENSGDP